MNGFTASPDFRALPKKGDLGAECGIRTTMPNRGQIGANRVDMMDLIGKDEQPSYDEILEQLRIALNSKKLIWEGKDDDYLFLGSF